MPTVRQRVQDDILRKRGLRRTGQGRLEKVKKRKAQPESIHLSEDKSKTLAMRLIEERLGLPMEALLQQGKGADIAKRLGVTISCISRWRLRLGLR